jgi:hypothetical protein
MLETIIRTRILEEKPRVAIRIAAETQRPEKIVNRIYGEERYSLDSRSTSIITAL